MSLFLYNMLSEPSYGHFVILSQGHAFHPNGHISETGPQNKKKLKKRKCPLFFDLRYDHFFFWSSGCKVRAIVSGRNCQYLGSWATNKKSKDTLLSQTLKVEEKKVTLVFWFVAQEPRYGLCIIFHVFPFDATLWKKGGLGGALPSHLGVWNFTWCLSSYRRMGKHTELNSNPTFVFFAPAIPIYPI